MEKLRFDGDGMLSGVLFQKTANGSIQPMFVNRFMLTDVYLASVHSKGRRAITPSIATLLSPITSLHRIMFSILRTVFLCFLSFFTQFPIKRISVANTAVLFHDGRALATCESGPPLWIELPTLNTVGWWSLDEPDDKVSLRGGGGITGMINEFTTAHVCLFRADSVLTNVSFQPKTDRATGELILYHATFTPPYLSYSVIPERHNKVDQKDERILSHPIPIRELLIFMKYIELISLSASPRMMHDFGVSRHYTVIMDCPLSLDPLNLARGRPVVNYSPNLPTRFGIFPRHAPESIRWYESDSCCIFHTANTWSTPATEKQEASVNLLCCRMNSSSLVYAAGNLPLPRNQIFIDAKEETCQLYYYSFPLSDTTPDYSFPLSIIPFEFPEVSPLTQMEEARYVYGCTMREGSFSVALGQASKIDCLVKFDVLALIQRGRERQNDSTPVDERSVQQILAESSTEGDIKVFALPDKHYAQEPSFVPRQNQRGEDDGFLLVYVFDESQLDRDGQAPVGSQSELWIIDAWDMESVVAKIRLPQRGESIHVVGSDEADLA